MSRGNPGSAEATIHDRRIHPSQFLPVLQRLQNPFSGEQSVARGNDPDGSPIRAFRVASPDVVPLRKTMQGMGAGLEVTWLV